MKKNSVFLFLFCLCLAVAQDANYLEAASGGASVKLALLPLKANNPSQKKLPADFAKIIERDLALGGRFALLPSQQIDSAAWAQLSIFQFIWGSYTWQDEKTLVLELRLHDVASMDMLLGQSYTVTAKSYRKAIHDFADQIIFQTFGQKGASRTKIAYMTKLAGQKEIAVMDYDGAHKIKITSHNAISNLPSWSHDNKKIYYTWFKNGHPEIVKQTLSSGKHNVLMSGVHAFGAKESPDGKNLVFTLQKNGGTDLYKYNHASKKKSRLTFHWAIETSPEWSPNGYEIMYSSNRGGNPQLYKMDFEGGNVERVVFNGKYVESVSWSPDGSKIAYCIMDEGLLNIYIQDLAASTLLQITQNQGNNESPSWSPDGSMLTFSSTRTGKSQIFVTSSDGSRVEQITFQGENASPSWSNFYSETP